MDSGNSGSLQSSSGGGGGGDEEYDSRTADHQSISSFLNPSTHFASLSNPNPLLQPPPPPPSSHHHHPPPTNNNTFFDHSSSTFSHSQNSNPNPLYNLDPIWSRNLRSDPAFADFGSAQNQNQTQMASSQQPMYVNPAPADGNTKTGRGPDHHVGVTTKNPKKRTRASRRAPTTVLTTDTTNFRQMVQEFTGIPAAPFSATSSPFSRRLDLFGGGGGGGLGPLYPLRPSAQKIPVQTPPSFLNSAANMMNSGTSNNITTATTTTTTTVDANASSSNYQLPPSEIHEFSKQPPNLLNLQNPMFSFQSLLQTTLSQQQNAPILGTNTKTDNQQPNLITGFPSSSSSSTRWRGQDESLGSFNGGNGNSSDFNHHHHQQADKGLENVSSRSGGGDQVQGNVDSWICPSD